MRAGIGRGVTGFAAGLAASMATGGLYGLHAPLAIVLDHMWRVAGLMVIPGVVVGGLTGAAAAACTASVRARVVETLTAHGRGFGAAALVAPPASVLWLAVTARTLQKFSGTFHHVGLGALLQGCAIFAEAVAVAAPGMVLALALARRMPSSRVDTPQKLACLTVVGTAIAATLVAFGAVTGTENGRGNIFGVFGVLRRPELDLVPTLMLAMIAAGTAVLGVALARATTRTRSVVAASVAAIAVALFVGDATVFGHSPAGGRIDARSGPLQSMLVALRVRTDSDHDGHSRYFGGADCDDHNPGRNPDAQDIPGNGVDEDCSGLDAPRRPPRPVATPALSAVDFAALGLPANMNLLLITVDTLRADMLRARNGRVPAPRMARLAAEATDFTHAYALASGTYHAVGPMLIGRYAAECARDDAHFTRYLPANVTLAERLLARGFRTFGAAGHYYFEPRFGVSQGMGEWDTSASGVGEEAARAVTDDHVADTVVAMLRRHTERGDRFMAWAHFYDPHHEYVDHPGIPLRGDDDRARYEQEVAFTDQQVGRLLDALDATPEGRRTVVVLTADHGEGFSEHGTRWHGVELWQELIRVPLVIRVPGLAARQVTVPRSVIDLVPTLLELLSVPTPDADALSGRSLVPDIVGNSEPPRPLYAELLPGPHNRVRRAYIADGWKLLERGSGRFELYHLADDADELRDLADARPDALGRLRVAREDVRSHLRLVTAVAAPREP